MVRKCFINTSKLTISHTFTFIMPMLIRLVISGVCRLLYRVVLVAVTCRATLIFTFFRCCSMALHKAITTKQYFALTSSSSLLNLPPALLRVQAQARRWCTRRMQARMRNAVCRGICAIANRRRNRQERTESLEWRRGRVSRVRKEAFAGFLLIVLQHSYCFDTFRSVKVSGSSHT
jgi:hypothetical protein